MDHNLREMGISDQGVPRHMQRVGEAFYGRAQVYEAALGEGAEEGALAAALARNVYPDTGDGCCAAVLARYVRQRGASAWHATARGAGRGRRSFPEPGFAQAVCKSAQ